MAPAEPAPASPPVAAETGVRRLTAAAAWVCLAVVVAGANVTTTKSGDAVPTWPWGWAGSTAAEWIELSHRYVAGLLVLTTGVAALRTGSPLLRRIAWLVFGLVLVQAALGGVRVLVGAADESHGALPGLKVAHAVLGQAIYPLAVAAAAVASDWWAATEERPLDDAGLAMMRSSGLALAAVFLQVLLGALGRHAVLPVEVHAFAAILPLALIARVVLATTDLPRDVELLRGPTALLGFLAALQIAVGIAAYLAVSEKPNPLDRTLSQAVTLNLHVGISAAITGVLTTFALRSVRLWGVPTDERVAAARRPPEAVS